MIKKIYSLLSIAEKNQLRFLLVILITGALLDALGVAVFYPFIAMLKDPSILNNFPELLVNLQKFGISGDKQIIILFAVALIIFFILKNLFIIYMNYKQFNYTYKSQVNLAQKLYKKYIYNNYEFHINTNTSELYRNLKENSFWVYSGVLYPMIIIVTETFIILFILAILMYVSPKVTIYVILGFSITGYLFFSSIKSQIQILWATTTKQYKRYEQMDQSGIKWN